MATPPVSLQKQDDNLPQLSVLAQYIKDFSFENPNSPKSLAPQNQAPNLNIQVNVNAKPMAPSETDFEVELKVEGQAGEKSGLLFKLDLTYCCVLRVLNIPKEQLHPVVMIEGPRLLFPFARQIVADAVRNGGFPPLLIDPVDFAQLYADRIAELEAQQGAAGKMPPKR